MAKINKPIIKVIYENANWTRDMINDIKSIEYTDVIEAESDEVVITLNNSHGKWIGVWEPVGGAKIKVSFGYSDNIVECGTFTIDDISCAFPTEVTIRALATSVNSTLRTDKGRTRQKQTLKQIAESIAKDNGLTLVGDIAPITIGRRVQNDESDLAFLSRLAKSFNYVFNVKDNLLIFESIYKLHSNRSIRVFKGSHFEILNLQFSTIKAAKKAVVIWHNYKDNKTYKYESNKSDILPNGQAAGGSTANSATTGDTLVLHVRAENEQQAQSQANALLFQHNSKGRTLTFTHVGDPYILAGNNIELQDVGNYSGSYLLKRVTHAINKDSGYKVNGEGEMIKPIIQPEFINTVPRRKRPKPKPKVEVRRTGGGGGGFISYDSATA